jgi:outer membrane protein OmpA-like peptidoglycan-associated protein
VRVEVAGKARAARYENRNVYATKTKNVPVYAKRITKVPVYGNKTVKVPYKQLVKSTMELEGQTFFKLNRADLIPSAQTRLKQIAAQIRKNGYKGVIRITGNTCKLGDTKYDQRLSEQRAASVKAFLMREGFNSKHLIARGVGKSNPKYPTTPEQDFKNRRVDIEYVSEQSIHKTGYRNVTKQVQTGTRDITKQVRTGTRKVTERVNVGTKRVLVDKGAAGTPRVVWRTEVIATEPTWIKRALHHTIKHNRGVDTYFTMAGNSTATEEEETEGSTVTNDNDTDTSGETTNDNCCTANIPIAIGAEGDSFKVLGDNDNRTLISVTTSAGYIEIDSSDTSKHSLFFEPNGFVGTATITYTLSDGSQKTISIECYQD